MMLRQLSKCLFFALSVYFLTTSCVTYNKCRDKFNWTSDTIRTVVYRDTIIPVLIKGTDTVFATATIRDTLYVHSGLAHAQSFVVHDTLKLNVWSSDTVLKVRIDSALKVITTQNKQVVTITEKAKLDKILKWIFGCLAVVLLIVLVPRILKKK
jgi:hypothetical protein